MHVVRLILVVPCPVNTNLASIITRVQAQLKTSSKFCPGMVIRVPLGFFLQQTHMPILRN